MLIIKITMVIHSKMQLQERHEVKAVAAGANMLIKVIIQIILIDMVFSLDSILTVAGLVDNVLIMIIAVVVAIGIMMLFAGPVSRIIISHKKTNYKTTSRDRSDSNGALLFAKNFVWQNRLKSEFRQVQPCVSISDHYPKFDNRLKLSPLLFDAKYLFPK
ncbi:hypothetical protein ACFSPU_12025 [Haoranjiania flava]|uniref:Uncharacterized protein n=1 Tax=Haoranjiania flava TaxID=1856322 RepID=A0AAE3IR14_9BACT|nr:hypothetical protein [Haoranjiania flava]MCU7695586.1 hypothetical protein [Haoranjiania flava]